MAGRVLCPVCRCVVKPPKPDARVVRCASCGKRVKLPKPDLPVHYPSAFSIHPAWLILSLAALVGLIYWLAFLAD